MRGNIGAVGHRRTTIYCQTVYKGDCRSAVIPLQFPRLVRRSASPLRPPLPPDAAEFLRRVKAIDKKLWALRTGHPHMALWVLDFVEGLLREH